MHKPLVSQPYKRPTAKYHNFLFDVVNAADRLVDLKLRSHFSRVYHDWFPSKDVADPDRMRGYYRETCAWWRAEPREIALEEPDEEFGFHVIILRRKLRVIWTLVDSGDARGALHFVERIHRWLTRSFSNPNDVRGEEWRVRLQLATSYLEQVLPRLKVCANGDCSSRYFFRETQTKYCSIECALRAQELRRLEERRLKLPRRALTEEGKQRIVNAQRERWRKFRAARKRGSVKNRTGGA
jgi:hypothetical protein